MNILKQLIHPHKLLAIAKVVEYKNITYAARALHMTQPAVTNIIRQLEQHFGQTLVRAEGKRIMISDAAVTLAGYWKHLQHTYENLHQIMHAHEKGDLGLIRLYMVSTGKYIVPDLINQFMQQFPQVEFCCHIANREYLLQAIKNHEADLAIVTNPKHDSQIEAIKLRQNKLAFVVNPNHELANKTSISFAELAQQRFIIREKTALITQALFDYFVKYKTKPTISYEIDSTEAIKEAIMVGNSVALLPLDSVQRTLEHGLLHQLVLDDDDADQLDTQHWYVVKHNDYPLNAISQKFLNLITALLA